MFLKLSKKIGFFYMHKIIAKEIIFDNFESKNSLSFRRLRVRFLFTILECEWTERKMRAFFYSTFLFQNGQNAIPSILLPGAE